MEFIKQMNAQLSTFNERVAKALVENKTDINRLKQENKQLKEMVGNLANEIVQMNKVIDSLLGSTNTIEKLFHV